MDTSASIPPATTSGTTSSVRESPAASTPDLTLDLRSLTYISPPDENICCPICHAPLIDPVQTYCLHTFCNSCIQQALSTSPTCPIDRKPLNAENVSPAPIMIANIVNELVVICPMQGRGCPVSCARYLVEGHLREECGFVEVACEGEGCEEFVLRKDAGRGECLHRKVECAHCRDEMRKMDLQSHYESCPGISDVCPHCSLEFSRKEISAHIPSCPEELVQCSSSKYGCPFVCRRRELEDHHAECAFTLLAPVLESHETQIAALALENKHLRRKLDILIPSRSLPPPRNSSSATGGNTETLFSPSIIDEQTYHILSEQEHIRDDIERLSGTIAASEMKQSMLLMNETIRLKEELAASRSAIAGLRMQMHWLMSSRIHGLSGIQPGQGPSQVPQQSREEAERLRMPPPAPPREAEPTRARRISESVKL